MSRPILDVRALRCSFGSTVALEAVDLTVSSGEVVALLGANGAGKSTLIKVLAGVLTPQGGEITIDGRRFGHGLTAAAGRSHGLAFVHQDLGLVGTLTVSENIALVAGYRRRRGLIDWRRQTALARQTLERLGAPIDPAAMVADLEPSAQALVAIARALAVDARLLVLDEPTASLPADDTDLLFAAIDRIRGDGVGVLYVTHRLAEVERLADRIVVLRDGVVAGRYRVADAHEDDVVESIVGQRVDRGALEVPAPTEGKDRLRLSGIDGLGVAGVSLEVATGEIVALVGLMGAGQRQVGRIVAGTHRQWRGSMTLDGQPYRPRHPRDALRQGVAYLPADRLLEAGFSSLDSGTNYLARRSARTTLVRPRVDRSLVRSRLQEWGVTPSAPDAPFASLSGGNQQRLLLAKWMDRQPRVFVVDEPTAGVDAAAKAAIHHRLAEGAKGGLSALLLSSDLDEVARVAHRALVFDRGRLVSELGRRDLSPERIASECYRAKAPAR